MVQIPVRRDVTAGNQQARTSGLHRSANDVAQHPALCFPSVTSCALRLYLPPSALRANDIDTTQMQNPGQLSLIKIQQSGYLQHRLWQQPEIINRIGYLKSHMTRVSIAKAVNATRIVINACPLFYTGFYL